MEAINLCLDAIKSPRNIIAVESPTYHGILLLALLINFMEDRDQVLFLDRQVQHFINCVIEKTVVMNAVRQRML